MVLSEQKTILPGAEDSVAPHIYAQVLKEI
jgi:hypothetical protein